MLNSRHITRKNRRTYDLVVQISDDQMSSVICILYSIGHVLYFLNLY